MKSATLITLAAVFLATLCVVVVRAEDHGAEKKEDAATMMKKKDHEAADAKHEDDEAEDSKEDDKKAASEGSMTKSGADHHMMMGGVMAHANPEPEPAADEKKEGAEHSMHKAEEGKKEMHKAKRSSGMANLDDGSSPSPAKPMGHQNKTADAKANSAATSRAWAVASVLPLFASALFL